MENSNAQAQLLPIRKIKEGFNYRRRYDPAKMASLQASIKEHGLIQPVTVRQSDSGDYQLIAGGRRLRAYVAEFGQEAAIPAIVRILSDAEATAAMIAENNEREDPSVIEDAEGAARMLSLCKGNRDEAARRLGWTRNKLERRLAIMNAIQPVRDAYLEDKILVGHVEILAALRKEVQVKVIEMMLSAPSMPTVEQLKAMAEQSLLGLEKAIFDRADCDGCQFNTGYQQSMFDTSFAGSRCTNRECFDSKTEQELDNRRQALTETYQVVRIVRPGDNMTVLPLRAEGPRGVGKEQDLACRTCGDFGACVSAVPDKMGNVYKDVCFNKGCNDQKVDAFAKASQNQKKAQDIAAAKGLKPQAHGATQAGEASTSKQAEADAMPESKPKVNSLRQAILDYREGIWRAIFSREALKSIALRNRALLVALVLNRSSDLDGHSAAKAICKDLGIELPFATDTARLLSELLKLDQAALANAMQQLPAHVSKTMPINEIKGFLQALEVCIEGYWKLNENFLDILTKAEIDAVCVEIGLADAAGKHYDKLKNGPKADFIKAMLAVEGFEYIGAVPKMMRWD